MNDSADMATSSSYVCMAVPLALRLIDCKVACAVASTISQPLTPEALSIYKMHYSSATSTSDVSRLLHDNHELASTVDSMLTMMSLTSFRPWKRVLNQLPMHYLKLAITVDLVIRKGAQPAMRDLPICLQSSIVCSPPALEDLLVYNSQVTSPELSFSDMNAFVDFTAALPTSPLEDVSVPGSTTRL
jgi:hypothetical protein